MRYKEAFDKTIKQYGYDVLNNAFLFYSLLSDNLNSPLDNALNKAFFIINSRLLIYPNIRYKNLKESKETIKEVIKQSPTDYSIKEYIMSVEPLLLSIFPNEYVPIGTNNNGNKPTIVKNNNKVNNVTPIIVRKEAPKKKVTVVSKSSITIKYVHIACSSTKLSILNGNFKEIKIFDDQGIEVDKNLFKIHKNGYFMADLPDKSYEYTIYLPQKRYHSLDVNFSGKYLDIGNYKSGKICATKMEINASDCKTDMMVGTNSLTCSQNSGELIVDGKLNNVNIYTNSASIDFTSEKNYGNQYVMTTNSGNINLEFSGTSIKPKINHLLKRVRNVSGYYQNGSKAIRLFLTSNLGYIKAK